MYTLIGDQHMTQHDQQVILWLAARACDFHNTSRADQAICGFCGYEGSITNRMVELYQYAKTGEIPFKLAVERKLALAGVVNERS